MPDMYQLTVRGRLSQALRAELEDLGLAVGAAEVETHVHGPVIDRAALYGLVRRLESYGLELVELRQYPEVLDQPDAREE